MLEHVYNNDTRVPLLWSRDISSVPAKQNQKQNVNENTKKTFFLPYRSDYNSSVDQLIQENGGRNDIDTVKLWALMGEKVYEQNVWGFFSPCTTPDGDS